MTKNSKAVVISPGQAEAHLEVSGLLGKKCWRANFAYGGELCLHFGRHLRYESPLMKGMKRGEWQLRTRGTAWEVCAPSESFSSTEGREDVLQQKLGCLVGRKVKDMTVTAAKVLMIEFEDKIFFRITPTSQDAKLQLPFWELGMPQHKTASFEPGSGWSIRASNVPRTEVKSSAKPVRQPLKPQA